MNVVNSHRRILRRDPTLTITIRKQWVTEGNKRINTIKRFIRETIVTNDAFGLKERPLLSFLAAAPVGAFDQPSDAEKLVAFSLWLKQQFNTEFLQLRVNPSTGQIIRIDPNWTQKYVDRAYLMGVKNANRQLKKTGIDPAVEPVPGSRPRVTLAGILAIPIHRQGISAMRERVLNELDGIANATQQQATRVLADGLARGDTPAQLTRSINEVMDKVAKQRATALALTETVRAHAEAQLNQFEAFGITEVTAIAEFTTQGDEFVCPICLALEGRLFPINEAHGIIPVHVRCVGGETRVNAVDASKAIRTYYTGELLTLELEDRVIECTPNHIFLSHHGFFKTQDFRVGASLLCQASTDGHTYATKIESFFAEESHVHALQGNLDLHGDGPNCSGLWMSFLRQGDYSSHDNDKFFREINESFPYDSREDKPRNIDEVLINQEIITDAMDGQGLELKEIKAIKTRHVENYPVYDMETDSSLYLAEGIVSSNCACFWSIVGVQEVRDREPVSEKKFLTPPSDRFRGKDGKVRPSQDKTEAEVADIIGQPLPPRNLEQQPVIVPIILEAKEPLPAFDGLDGEPGTPGVPGTGIQHMEILKRDLLIYLTNGSGYRFEHFLGLPGTSIINAEINEHGELILSYDDDKQDNLGRIQGRDGISMTDATLKQGELIIETSDGTELNLGNVIGDSVKGTPGINGTDGIGVSDVGIVGTRLFMRMSNDNILDLGDVKGEKGDPGPSIVGPALLDVKLMENNSFTFYLDDGTEIQTNELELNHIGFVEAIEFDPVRNAIRWRVRGVWSDFIPLGTSGGGGGGIRTLTSSDGSVTLVPTSGTGSTVDLSAGGGDPEDHGFDRCIDFAFILKEDFTYTTDGWELKAGGSIEFTSGSHITIVG